MRLFKCLYCNSSSVDEIVFGDKVMYKCYSCGKTSPKVHSIDSRLKFSITEGGEIKHYLTAVLLSDKDGDLLMINRRNFPYKWSLIMGHVHNGENDIQAATRELMEETSLELSSRRRYFDIDVIDACDAGANIHNIVVFRDNFIQGKHTITNSEAADLQWFSTSELAKKIKENKVSLKAVGVLRAVKLI